jgi:site-specific DNA-methyltransferase (adenine-specific)
MAQAFMKIFRNVFMNLITNKLKRVVKFSDSKRLVQLDCINLPRHFSRQRFDLIYADPPFFTNTTWESKARVGQEKTYRFDDRFDSIEAYRSWLEPRLKELSRALSSQGVLALHLDHHAVSHAFELLSGILGAENYVGEIIWQYGLGGGKSSGSYSKKHDTILFWARNVEAIEFNPQVFEEHGTVWEIQSLNPMSLERVGYPTQKPTELLERIVSLFPKCQSVLDPFCGSGTTLVAAERLSIPVWMGLDISETAIKVAELRCRSQMAANNEKYQVVSGAPSRLKEVA